MNDKLANFASKGLGKIDQLDWDDVADPDFNRLFMGLNLYNSSSSSSRSCMRIQRLMPTQRPRC